MRIARDYLSFMRHQYTVYKTSQEKSRDQNHTILPQVSIFKARESDTVS